MKHITLLVFLLGLTISLPLQAQSKNKKLIESESDGLIVGYGWEKNPYPNNIEFNPKNITKLIKDWKNGSYKDVPDFNCKNQDKE